MENVHLVLDSLASAFGVGVPAHALTLSQVLLRGVVVYLAGMTMVRLAPRRFMGRHTPFDLILGIVLGAVLARSINGSAPLLPTLAVGFALVFLDRALAAAAYRWRGFRDLVEGRSLPLVREGRLQGEALRRCYLSAEDLEAALRTRGGLGSPEEVLEARIERSGEVSVIPRRPGRPPAPAAS